MKTIVTCLFCLIGFCTSAQKVVAIKSELIFNNPPFAFCHAATVVELPNHQLMVSCFDGPFESSPQTSIWLTSYQNKQWTKWLQ